MTPDREAEHPDVTRAGRAAGLYEGQTLAAAVASTDPLVIVEGAAGSGKTTMLRTAITMTAEHGRSARVVAPTKRAAQVAHKELDVPATARLATTGRFGRRKANRDRTSWRGSSEFAHNMGRATPYPETLSAWAAQAAARRAESDPRTDTDLAAVETAHVELKATRRRHKQERLVLLVNEFGADEARRDQYGMRTVNPHRNAQDARARIALVRAEANELRNFPAGDAARRIKAKRAEQEQTRQRAA